MPVLQAVFLQPVNLQRVVSLSPQPKELKKIPIERGGAWYVTITPLEWDKGAEFCVALRILVSVPQERGKPKTGTQVVFS